MVAGPLNLNVEAKDSHSQAADAVLGLTISQTLTQQQVYSYTVPMSGGYAPNGNLLSYTDTVMGTWNFSYDHLNRISSAIPGAGAPSGYSGENLCMAYDSFGDRTQSNFQTTACSTSNPATAKYSAANQVTWTTVNSASNGFTYDASGNVTFDGVNYYAYDSEGVRGAELAHHRRHGGLRLFLRRLWTAGGQGDDHRDLDSAGCIGMQPGDQRLYVDNKRGSSTGVVCDQFYTLTKKADALVS